jgi:hypothetical protein
VVFKLDTMNGRTKELKNQKPLLRPVESHLSTITSQYLRL